MVAAAERGSEFNLKFAAGERSELGNGYESYDLGDPFRPDTG
jgi:hypothetical protein